MHGVDDMSTSGPFLTQGSHQAVLSVALPDYFHLYSRD